MRNLRTEADQSRPNRRSKSSTAEESILLEISVGQSLARKSRTRRTNFRNQFLFRKMVDFEFLNVDLEIHSRSSLEPLLSELGERVCVLYSESKPNKHFASVEISRYWKNPSPDKTIAALCNILESLSPKARAVWKKARSKVF